MGRIQEIFHMTARIVAICPGCTAELSVEPEKAGQQSECPSCNSPVQIPAVQIPEVQMPDIQISEARAPVVENQIVWTVAVGKKKFGPFEKSRLRALIEAGKIPAEALIRDEAETTDWREAKTVEWLFVAPKAHVSRYCSECDSRIVLAAESADWPQRCPACGAPGYLMNYLNFEGDETQHLPPAEPWGRFDLLVTLAASVAVAAGLFGAIALLWNPPLAVLPGLLMLCAGGVLFAFTFQHRSQTHKYRQRLPKLEAELTASRETLNKCRNELNSLKRNLERVRSQDPEGTEQEI
jgi:DNA-directed RNA polymerase subunit RPC12/RpoP